MLDLEDIEIILEELMNRKQRLYREIEYFKKDKIDELTKTEKLIKKLLKSQLSFSFPFLIKISL